MSECIFCKIANGEIPANEVMSNDSFFAFHDISPVAKVHVLVIPKAHIQSIAHITDENKADLNGMLEFIRDVAVKLGLDESGYRTILNSGEKAGQTVHHMHAHIIGGQELGWPGV